MTIFEFACVMATVAFVCVLIAASHSYGADRIFADQLGDCHDQGRHSCEVQVILS